MHVLDARAAEVALVVRGDEDVVAIGAPARLGEQAVAAQERELEGAASRQRRHDHLEVGGREARAEVAVDRAEIRRLEAQERHRVLVAQGLHHPRRDAVSAAGRRQRGLDEEHARHRRSIPAALAPGARAREPAVVRVALVHPELGIGGAERVVLDAARALTARGHAATVLVGALPERAFPEARDGSVDVRVTAPRVPVGLFGRARVPLAMLRMAAAAPALRAGRFDVVLCDLVPHVVPLLARAARAPVVYYGHYPDLLLAPPGGRLYAAYRAPIDRLEAHGLRAATRVLTNSRFSAAAFARLFPGAGAEVLSPPVPLSDAPDADDGRTLVVLARADPRKQLPLAVEAFAALRTRVPAARFSVLALVLAGPCDERLPEQRAVRAACLARAAALGVASQLVLPGALGDADRRALLGRALAVLHPATDEHFGLVPLEAMAAGRAVLCVDAGGPKETIAHGVTGILCAPTADAFADALAPIVLSPTRARTLGRAARAAVAEHHSPERFAEGLDAALRAVVR